MPNLIPNLKICLFVTKCPWGFVLSVTVRGNAFIAKQNRLSATARVLRTFAEVVGAKGLFTLLAASALRAALSYTVAASFRNLLRAQNPRTVWLIDRPFQNPAAVGLKAT